VHKGIEKGREPLQKHCDRCGCRESYLVSDHDATKHRPSGPWQVRPRPPQQSASTTQPWPSVEQQVPFSQVPLQHGSLAAQEPLSSRQREHILPPVLNTLQIRLQQSMSVVQPKLLSGRHIGVVVEVVLVEVEVVGVVVDVEVVLVVVLVEKHVGGLGSRQSSVPPHPPQQSHGWPACLAAASGLTQSVSAAPRRQVPSAFRGTWQILTVPGGQVIAAIALLEGISAAMAVPAKSLSAIRRLIDPSAKARARSSKERLVVCWLTCCSFSPKGGTLGTLAPP
jgi:hypothetical protein